MCARDSLGSNLLRTQYRLLRLVNDALSCCARLGLGTIVWPHLQTGECDLLWCDPLAMPHFSNVTILFALPPLLFSLYYPASLSSSARSHLLLLLQSLLMDGAAAVSEPSDQAAIQHFLSSLPTSLAELAPKFHLLAASDSLLRRAN